MWKIADGEGGSPMNRTSTNGKKNAFRSPYRSLTLPPCPPASGLQYILFVGRFYARTIRTSVDAGGGSVSKMDDVGHRGGRGVQKVSF